MHKLSINFEKILSRASGDFEEQNKVVENYIILFYAVALQPNAGHGLLILEVL